jgi:hypothetical protein
MALIAVCNKLLKQAIAIAKSGLIYNENYQSVWKKLSEFYLFFTTVLCCKAFYPP